VGSEHCEECGRELEPAREGSVQGLLCKNCGWAVITSYIPAIELDETDYEVRARGGDYRNESHVRAVSELSGCNFLNARKLLQQHEPVVFTGKAPGVLRARNVLSAAGLDYQILPPFSHTD
jgi:large subunit ribosomal protein L7/L12